MIGRCPSCPEKDRLVAILEAALEAKDVAIATLTQQVTTMAMQLEAREKSLMAMFDPAAYHARFPKERPPMVAPPAPTPKVPTSPAAFARQIYRDEEALATAAIEQDFKLEQVLKERASEGPLLVPRD